MIRSDTLMRYIRIFSELANTIRYSTNRRVQIELALIKLCRPEAEKDELSLVERIRKLERAAEQGAVFAQGGAGQANGYKAGAQAGQMNSYEMGAQGGQMNSYGMGAQGGYDSDGSVPEEAWGQYMGGGGGYPDAANASPNAANAYQGTAAPYQKAAPEDLQKVKAKWKSIIGATSGLFRMVLSASEPKFNAQDANDGRLFVVFADFLGERYLTNSERRQELEQIIADQTGKQVEIKFVLAADEGIQRGALSKIDLDERIREFIHTDIEITDEN